MRLYHLILRVISLMLITTVPVCATGLVEAWDLFSIKAPPGWVYQLQESKDNILVFYGPGEDGLLYIEYLGAVADCSAMNFAKRVIKNYESEHGLNDFVLVEALREYLLDGISVIEAVYDYQGRILRRERRLFVIIAGQGISITYSNAPKQYGDYQEDFQCLLANWRWLVGE